MKKVFILIFLSVLFFSARAQYCMPEFSNPEDQYINFFQFNTLINYYSGHNATANSVYSISDFTTLVTIGKTYYFQVAEEYNSGAGGRYALWIDYNNDGTFSQSEQVYTSGNGVSYCTGYITIPNDTSLIGIKRMRIMHAYYWGNIFPCNSYDFGESEDYYIQITDSVVNPEYCIPINYEGYPAGFAVGGFRLNDLMNCNSGSNAIYYINYPESSFTTHLEIGRTYRIFIGCGSTGISGGFAAWIDYNNNSVFETSEMICHSGSDVFYTWGNVTIPNNSSLIGKHRLRVHGAWAGNGGYTSPCGGGNDFETEDYTINIVPYVPDTTPVFTPEWEKIINITSNQTCYNMHEMYDKGFIISCKNSSSSENLMLIKLSVDGTALWTKNFPSSYNNLPYGLDVTHDGGFIIAGYTSETDQNAGAAYVMKLNACGNQQWKKFYGITGDYEYMSAIYQLNDNNYIVLGHYMGNDNINNERISLLKLSTSGDIIWTGNYTHYNNSDAKSFILTHDHGFLISGSAYTSATGDTSGAVCLRSFIIKIDSTGQEQWNSVLGASDNLISQAVASAELPDGFLTINSMEDSTNNYLTGLYKTNLTGHIVWVRTLFTDSFYNYAGKDIYKINDNLYAIATTRFDDCADYDYRIAVFTIDSTGAIIHSNTFGKGSTVFSSINGTHDGKLIISGTNESTSGSYKIYALKLTTTLEIDTFYNVALNYDSICRIIQNENNPMSDSMYVTISPNPFKKYTSLNIINYKNQLYHVQVFNVNGEKVNEYKNCRSGSLKIYCPGFVSGVFFVNLIFKDGTVINRKIILFP